MASELVASAWALDYAIACWKHMHRPFDCFFQNCRIDFVGKSTFVALLLSASNELAHFMMELAVKRCTMETAPRATMCCGEASNGHANMTVDTCVSAFGSDRNQVRSVRSPMGPGAAPSARLVIQRVQFRSGHDPGWIVFFRRFFFSIE